MEKYGKVMFEVLVELVLWEVLFFEEYGFGDIKISVKYNDLVVMVVVYELFVVWCDYLLYFGVIEVGFVFQGIIKFVVVFGVLLLWGIGDIIWVLLLVLLVEEVKVGNQVFELLNLWLCLFEIVFCLLCGCV